jgi:hypothetical protein
VSASYIALSGSYNTFSGSASTRVTKIENNYATTGSNSFRADQSITGSLVVSSTITAQTLVVQTVTSSIVYSSGSNIFGNQLANTQTFTGSVNITGSLALAGNITSNGTAVVLGSGTINYLPKFTGASTIGNSAITDDGTTVTLVSRALSGTSATFSGNVIIGGSSPVYLKFNVQETSANRVAILYRGTQGADASMVTAFGTPYLSIGGQENLINSIQTIGFGFTNGTSYIQPAEIGFQTTSLSGYTKGDLVFATRGDTTNTAPTKRMTLDASGNLGLGVTPSNAYGDSRTFEFGAGGILWAEQAPSIYNSVQFGSNFYYNSVGDLKYKNSGVAASRYFQYQGSHIWNYAGVAPSAGAAITFTQAMTLTAAGRLLIGTPTEATYMLDVNGTGRVQTSLTISSTTNSSLVAATNSTTGYTFVDLINNGASGVNYQIGVGGNGAASGYANNLYFDLVGVGNVMTLTSTRNIGFGVTPSAWGTGANYNGYQFKNASLYVRTGSPELYINNNAFYDGTNWKYIVTAPAAKLEMVNNEFTFQNVANGTAGATATFVNRMIIFSGGQVAINRGDAGGGALGVRGFGNTDAANAFYVDNSSSAELFSIRNDGVIRTGTAAGSPYNNTSAQVPNLYVSAGGTLERGTSSSMRYKENIIHWEGSGINTILALKPTTFTYKESYYKHPERVMLGLIAEEVAEACPYLADYENEDGSGQVENVRYAYIVVPLIKAIQEQQVTITSLQAQITELKAI